VCFPTFDGMEMSPVPPDQPMDRLGSLTSGTGNFLVIILNQSVRSLPNAAKIAVEDISASRPWAHT
jgi:hypothetical protein